MGEYKSTPLCALSSTSCNSSCNSSNNRLKYKLIVSDLDATLLNSSGLISDRTIEAIRRYQALGGLFTYATGRSEVSSRIFAEQAGIKIPGIAYNGAKVVSHLDGIVIYETFLDGECTKKAYIALRKLNKDVIIYLENSRHVAEFTDVIGKYMERVRQGVKIIKDIDKVIGGSGNATPGPSGHPLRNEGGSIRSEGGYARVKKLLVIDPQQEEELIINATKPIFGDDLNCIKSDPQYYEFLAPGTSKGQALKALAGHLGIGLNETVAIGDHLNDISMIEAAGLGAAVANAEKDVLDAADYITESNDNDGVALLIEKLINGDLL